MGFEVPQVTTTIVFDPPSRYAGAEVLMSLDMSIDEAIALEELQTSDVGAVMDSLGGLIISWNLTKGGEPVPVTALRQQPLGFVMTLFDGMKKAMQEVISVDTPFASPSRDGATPASTN